MRYRHANVKGGTDSLRSILPNVTCACHWTMPTSAYAN